MGIYGGNERRALGERSRERRGGEGRGKREEEKIGEGKGREAERERKSCDEEEPDFNGAEGSFRVTNALLSSVSVNFDQCDSTDEVPTSRSGLDHASAEQIKYLMNRLPRPRNM